MNISNTYDAEKVAKACEKSMLDKAAELYRIMAKQVERNT